MRLNHVGDLRLSGGDAAAIRQIGAADRKGNPAVRTHNRRRHVEHILLRTREQGRVLYVVEHLVGQLNAIVVAKETEPSSSSNARCSAMFRTSLPGVNDDSFSGRKRSSTSSRNSTLQLEASLLYSAYIRSLL
jgi:hypothetical protein